MKIFSIAVAFLMLAWGINYFGDEFFSGSPIQSKSQQSNELIKAGDECVAISERATAHIIPKLEFQRLELAGRKANVVVKCMTDHGFRQNPAWLEYYQPVAAKVAAEQHISIDEALENIKRKDMLVFAAREHPPIYWLPVKKADK